MIENEKDRPYIFPEYLIPCLKDNLGFSDEAINENLNHSFLDLQIFPDVEGKLEIEQPKVHHMIRRVSIENFKSIIKLMLPLGRINVLIGENGSGKSNILEAICIAFAAKNSKLKDEDLVSYGIRSVNPDALISAFDQRVEKSIHISLETRGSYDQKKFTIRHDGSKWYTKYPLLAANLENESDYFAIYSPEKLILKNFNHKNHLKPLSVEGEGLFELLKNLASQNKLEEIKENIQYITWFEDFSIESILEKNTLCFQDRHLESSKQLTYNDISEGFLSLLFYICLLISKDTPPFFAIDNMGASLNPKACRYLMQLIVFLSSRYNKQVILTTHNPAVLDGLDLSDEEQKLFVVSRGLQGDTKITRVQQPQKIAGVEPVEYSTAFIRGYLGGLSRGNR